MANDTSNSEEQKSSRLGEATKKAKEAGSQAIKTVYNALGGTDKLIEMGASTLADIGKDALQLGTKGSALQSSFISAAGKMQGGKMFSDLQGLSHESGMGKSVYEDAEKLMGMNVNAKDVVPQLRMLANIGGGNSQKTAQLTEAFGQANVSGHLTGDQEKVFEKAGFNPLAELSKMTGKDTTVLNKEMGEGKITVDMLKEAFAHATAEGGDFHDKMKEGKNTSEGKMEALQGDFDNAKMQLGMALDEPLKKLMDSLQTNFMDKLPGIIELVSPIIGNLLGMVGELMPTIMSFGRTVLSLIKPIADFFTSKAMTGLLKNVMDLGKHMVDVVVPIIKVIAFAVETVLNFLNPIIHIISKVVGGVTGGIASFFSSKMDDNVTEDKGDIWKHSGGDDIVHEMDASPLLLEGIQVVPGGDYMPAGPSVPKAQSLIMPENQKPNTALSDMPGYNVIPGAQSPSKKQNTPVIPKQTDKKPPPEPHAAHASDAITSGGKKQIVINVNAPMYKVEHQIFQRLNDAIQDFEPKVRMALISILDSANMAM